MDTALSDLLSRPEAERTLGPFSLVHQLGRGGFAPVWLAREVYGGKEVRTAAVKLFSLRADHASDSPMRARDLQAVVAEEARLLCQVEHPNVVRFYSLVVGDRVAGLAMEYVAGTALDRAIERDGKLGVTDILEVGISVASALAAVHRAGLLHRDVKPANVIDASGIYKLIDFGIAAVEAPPGAARAHSPARSTTRLVIDDLPLDLARSHASTLSVHLRSDARLVVREVEGLTLAHEALLTQWRRLQGWVARRARTVSWPKSSSATPRDGSGRRRTTSSGTVDDSRARRSSSSSGTSRFLPTPARSCAEVGAPSAVCRCSSPPVRCLSAWRAWPLRCRPLAPPRKNAVSPKQWPRSCQRRCDKRSRLRYQSLARSRHGGVVSRRPRRRFTNRWARRSCPQTSGPYSRRIDPGSCRSVSSLLVASAALGSSPGRACSSASSSSPTEPHAR